METENFPSEKGFAFFLFSMKRKGAKSDYEKQKKKKRTFSPVSALGNPDIFRAGKCHDQLCAGDLVVCPNGAGAVHGAFDGVFPVSYTHLTLPTICSV